MQAVKGRDQDQTPAVVAHCHTGVASDGPDTADGPAGARAIAETGGAVGIWHFFPSLERYVESLKEMADIVGVDHVSIGTDQHFTLGSVPDYTQWVHLVAAMLRGGFAAEEAGKIAGGNYMRIFRASGWLKAVVSWWRSYAPSMSRSQGINLPADLASACTCGSFRPMASSDVDIVRWRRVVVGLVEKRAVVPLHDDPRDRKPIFFGAAPKMNSDRVADRDVGWQSDVVVGVAGDGYEPIAAFGQHPRTIRRYHVHFASGCAAYTKDDQSGGNQNRIMPEPSPISK